MELSEETSLEDYAFQRARKIRNVRDHYRKLKQVKNRADDLDPEQDMLETRAQEIADRARGIAEEVIEPSKQLLDQHDLEVFSEKSSAARILSFLVAVLSGLMMTGEEAPVLKIGIIAGAVIAVGLWFSAYFAKKQRENVVETVSHYIGKLMRRVKQQANTMYRNGRDDVCDPVFWERGDVLMSDETAYGIVLRIQPARERVYVCLDLPQVLAEGLSLGIVPDASTGSMSELLAQVEGEHPPVATVSSEAMAAWGLGDSESRITTRITTTSTGQTKLQGKDIGHKFDPPDNVRLRRIWADNYEKFNSK